MKHIQKGIEKNYTTTARLEAFSDGVFAIAITLLILELIEMLRSSEDATLKQLLLNNWASFVAFIVGFLTILICWINHHSVVSHIKKVDTNVMWVNGFVLLIVTFTPFPTYILAEYISKESHSAVAVFGFNYFMMSVAAYCITAYPYKKMLIEENSRKIMRGYKLLYGYSIFYTLFIIPLCFVYLPLSLLFYCILFIVFAFPDFFALKILKAYNFG